MTHWNSYTMWKHSLTLQDKMKYCGRLILTIFILLYTVTSEIWGFGGFCFCIFFCRGFGFYLYVRFKIVYIHEKNCSLYILHFFKIILYVFSKDIILHDLKKNSDSTYHSTYTIFSPYSSFNQDDK